MIKKISIVVALAVIGFSSLVHAQYWDGDRRAAMHRLREACDDGDDRACWRLEHMRREMEERREWRHRDRDWEGPR
jgi:hypothetical protein